MASVVAQRDARGRGALSAPTLTALEAREAYVRPARCQHGRHAVAVL